MWIVTLLSLIAPLCGTQKGGDEDRASSDQAQYFESLPSLLPELVGTYRAFRYRRVHFSCQGTIRSSVPTELHDGVVFVEYTAGGVLVQKYDVTIRDARQELVTPRRETSYYSMASGEYARAAVLAGGTTDQVVIDHWSALPAIVYLGIGLADYRSVLQGLRPQNATTANGVVRVLYATEYGPTIEVESCVAPGTRLSRIEVVSMAGEGRILTFFHGEESVLHDGPLAPAMIVRTRLSPTCCIMESEVWNLIDIEWDDSVSGYELQRGSHIVDVRVGEGPALSGLLDRPMSMMGILSYPLTVSSNGYTESVTGKVAGQSQGRKGPTVMILTAVGIVLAIGAVLVRRRGGL